MGSGVRVRPVARHDGLPPLVNGHRQALSARAETLRPEGVARPAFARPTILLVEPDELVAEDLARVLTLEGFRAVSARTGSEAISRMATVAPNIVLVDFDLPDAGGGAELCRQIRADGGPPVIVLSRSDGEASAMASFEAGADDYVHQLSRGQELAARVRAALRRSPRPIHDDSELLVVGDLELDVERHEVRVGGRAVKLPLREFQLLHVLLSSAGKTWSRTSLMRRVWGETPPSGTKSLDVHVKRIRARIEDDPQSPTRILTIRGVGYKYALATDARATRPT